MKYKSNHNVRIIPLLTQQATIHNAHDAVTYHKENKKDT